MRIALLALALLVATGCDSTDDIDGGGGGCASGTLTATTDGSAFTAECVTFTLDGGALGLGGITNADGSDGTTQRQITLVVPGARQGTADAPTGFVGTYTDGALDGTLFTGTSTTGLTGSVTLTELSEDRAVGTFSFSGLEFELSASAGGTGGGTPTGRTVAVTSGSFDIRR